ncbi:glycosyl hydrolase [Massilioclostridium coli]|uniref:glycosyl hydrolase n=1 Tax=Massilioclostridium coli TaxID=1870991 RepID=UPI00085BC449|nr:glycosyl hydrolase [Massilioclostridium coli]
MKKAKKLIAAVTSLALAASCFTGVLPVQAAESGNSTFQTEFKNASNHDSKLRVRYWIPGGWAAKDLDEIDREIKELADAGYGCVEVADVRDKMSQSELDALAQKDENGDTYLYGSKNWEKSVKQILKSAKKYGLTVDMTFGQRWPASSNEITPNDDAAAKELVYGTVELSNGQNYQGSVPVTSKVTTTNEENPVIENDLIGIYAAKYDSTKEVETGGGWMQPATKYTQYSLDQSTMVQLTPNENGEIDFTAPDDNYVVVAIYQRGTGQLVGYQPSMDNHTGTNYDAYVVDHFSDAGVNVMQKYYENNLFSDPETAELIKEVGGNWFEDSLEMTTAGLWTYDMLEEFQEETGYDLTNYLPFVLKVTGMDSISNNSPFILTDDTDNLVTNVRNDYVETLSNLYNYERTQDMVDWAETYGMGYRVQAYGSTIDSALTSAIATTPEGESLTFGNKHDSFRVMAAGRDMGGNTILSDEIGANFGYGSAYGFPFDDLIANFNKNYAAGVNSMYLHGYSYAYSPEAQWPGFHAFGSDIPGPFSSRMPEWEHINDITGYIDRTQYVLQQGVQKTDVAIYQPTYNASYGAPYYTDTGLTEAGYSYQFFTRSLFNLDSAVIKDGVLNPDGPGYRAMIINNVSSMAVETIDKLIEYANAGFPIIVVGQTPTTSISLVDNAQDVVNKFNELLAIDGVVQVENTSEVVSALEAKGIEPAVDKQTANADIVTIHRTTEDADFYYLFNDAGEQAQLEIALEGNGTPYLLDGWTGEITPIANYTIEDGQIIVPVDLATNDAMMVGISSTGIFGEPADNHAISSNAKVSYKDGNLTVRATEDGTYTVVDEEGKEYNYNVTGLAEPIDLNDWNLTVQSWSKGDNADNDVLDTKKEDIAVGKTDLIAWKDIPQLGSTVSGIGTYSTTFNFDTSNNTSAYLDVTEVFDTFRVFVNGQQLPAINQITKQIDLGDYLVDGENTLVIEVASTLANAVGSKKIQEYGVIGDVCVVPYQDITVKEADKGVLNSVIAYAEQAKASGEYDNAIASVQKSFDEALTNAKAVAGNAAATQEEVNAAWKTLMNEIHKLGFVAGDKTALASLIAAAEGIDLSKYVEAGQAEFTAALEAAQNTYNNGDAMQAEINEVADNLLNAMLNLRYKADKSILEEVVAEAEKVDANAYTAESYAVLEAAVNEAKAVLENENATQKEVDAAVQSVQAAMDSLVAVEGTETPSDNNATQTGQENTTTKANAAKTGDFAPIAGVVMLAVAGTAVLLSRKKK